MEDKYGIWEHPTIKSLYAKREMWMMIYFKDLYYGRMTSTQRSESTNRVMKDGFVNSVTSLHMDHIDTEESRGSGTNLV
jgi:hypothetical protein